ncbi:hypothetical protein [Tsuneonella sp. HG222]
MTRQSRLRRMGWFAALGLSTIMYGALHLKVHAVRSEVVNAERRLVALEGRKIMLETEFETRASQERLASWNRVEFGYVAPGAKQFVGSTRELAEFGAPRSAAAPAPIRVASVASENEVPAFPRMVSPLTGKPVDEALVEPEPVRQRLSAGAGSAVRIPLDAIAGTAR